MSLRWVLFRQTNERARRAQSLLPVRIDDYIGQDNPVGVIDAFVDELDLAELGLNDTAPAITGRPSYHQGVMLKTYIYGYLNRIPSSRRLERERQRNGEPRAANGTFGSGLQDDRRLLS